MNYMELKLTELLLQSANSDTELLCRMERLAARIKEILKNRYSLTRMKKELEPFSADTGLLRFVVETLKSQGEPPTLSAPDYKAYMILLACSPADFAFCYLSNDVTGIYERQTQYTKEMLFFCDLLRLIRGRSYLNCVENRVSDYFFQQRRNLLKNRPSTLEEHEIQYAESRLKGLARVVFRLKVDIFSYHTFVAEELAEMCGMSYSLFRSRFLRYYGMSASDWLRQERISRIKTDMTCRPELSIKEVAERNQFSSASNFADFCNQQLQKNPSELAKECYEIWKDRRINY